MTLANEHDYLRAILLGLPGVRLGRRFGGEAFFVGKRFFCHFHHSGELLLLETFVWNNVRDALKSVPGTIPHPEYANQGWVRFRVASKEDLSRASKLIELSYGYVIRTKRISLPKNERARRRIERARESFPSIRFSVRESLKRIQVIVGVRQIQDPVQAVSLLNRVAAMLR